MIRHPEVQRKAQAEIDLVIGPDRLPEIADRPSLPYIQSLLIEVLRWGPATPMGTFHEAIHRLVPILTAPVSRYCSRLNTRGCLRRVLYSRRGHSHAQRMVGTPAFYSSI